MYPTGNESGQHKPEEYTPPWNLRVDESSITVLQEFGARNFLMGDGELLCPECGHMGISQRPEPVQVGHDEHGIGLVVVPLVCLNGHELDLRVEIGGTTAVDLVGVQRFDVPWGT